MARGLAGYATALILGAVLAAAMVFATPGDAAADDDFEWVFEGVSPNAGPANPGEVVSRTDVGFSRIITVEPAAEFNVDFAEMMIATASPGTTHSFTVDVEGRISADADTTVQGFRVNDAILLVDGSWVGRTAVGVGVNCVSDIFGRPLGCTPEAGTFARASGTFTVTFPAVVPEDGRFRFGVGALNCPECFVEYVFRARTPQPAPMCGGRRATIDADARTDDGRIVGTPGADVIVGSARADFIDGRGGNDVICGMGGGDEIDGGRGADTIMGGNGADVILGGAGRDDLRGGRGNDIIRGGVGADRANGQAGTDRCAAEREVSCEKDPRIAGPRVDWTVPDRYGTPRANGIVYPDRHHRARHLPRQLRAEAGQRVPLLPQRPDHGAVEKRDVPRPRPCPALQRRRAVPRGNPPGAVHPPDRRGAGHDEGRRRRAGLARHRYR